MNWLVLALRNRVVRMAGFVFMPMLLVLWWQLGGGPGEATSAGEAHGVITAVHKHAYLVTLDDGQQVRVFRTRKVAQGTRVQLRVSHYESGVTQYMLPGSDASPQ